MNPDWSSRICSLTSGGKSPEIFWRLCFTPSITSIVFAPVCLRTSRVTVGLPFTRDELRDSFVPSSA
jgi:hypothetical protein